MKNRKADKSLPFLLNNVKNKKFNKYIENILYICIVIIKMI